MALGDQSTASEERGEEVKSGRLWNSSRPDGSQQTGEGGGRWKATATAVVQVFDRVGERGQMHAGHHWLMILFLLPPGGQGELGGKSAFIQTVLKHLKHLLGYGPIIVQGAGV